MYTNSVANLFIPAGIYIVDSSLLNITDCIVEINCTEQTLILILYWPRDTGHGFIYTVLTVKYH